VTFAGGDRVKVEFEGTVRWFDEGFNLVGIGDLRGEEYLVPESYLTKIEKVYPAGSVWVWRLPDGSVDTTRPSKTYTVSEFCSTYSWASADNIIAIHEPERS
jgi:hypothetical protein